MTELQTVLTELANIRALIERPPVHKITVSIKDLMVMFDKCETTIYKIVKSSGFPAPLTIIGNINRCWLKADILKWAKARTIAKARR